MPSETETIDLGNGIKMEFLLIHPGSFVMGCTTGVATNNVCERPAHEVTITKPFYLGKYEVTQAQWVSVMGRNPSQFQPVTAADLQRPVEFVTWDDINGRDGFTATVHGGFSSPPKPIDEAAQRLISHVTECGHALLANFLKGLR